MGLQVCVPVGSGPKSCREEMSTQAPLSSMETEGHMLCPHSARTGPVLCCGEHEEGRCRPPCSELLVCWARDTYLGRSLGPGAHQESPGSTEEGGWEGVSGLGWGSVEWTRAFHFQQTLAECGAHSVSHA